MENGRQHYHAQAVDAIDTSLSMCPITAGTNTPGTILIAIRDEDSEDPVSHGGNAPDTLHQDSKRTNHISPRFIVLALTTSTRRRMTRVSHWVHALACLDPSGIDTSKGDVGVGIGRLKSKSRFEVPQLTSLGGLGWLRLHGRRWKGRWWLPAAVPLRHLRILLFEILHAQGLALWRADLERRWRVALHVALLPAKRVREGLLLLHAPERRRRDGRALAGVVLGAHGPAIGWNLAVTALGGSVLRERLLGQGWQRHIGRGAIGPLTPQAAGPQGWPWLGWGAEWPVFASAIIASRRLTVLIVSGRLTAAIVRGRLTVTVVSG
ncbi:uncharacterized protein PG986_007603 [Apiospora aurea]|uniref:Uncharacterized protein n=1 Tax=Apiospora aurea TaxID=335848 RepID=A0ABR1QD27_9PEZI